MQLNINRNLVKFLQTAADKIPPENRTHLLLKSYYLTRCNKISPSLTNRKSHANEEHCLGCYIKWKDQQFTMKIHQIKNRNKKAKKLVELKDSSSSITEISHSKQIRIENYRKQIHPISEIKCLVCGTKKKVIIRPSVSDKKKIKLINENTKVDDVSMVSTTENTDKELSNTKIDTESIGINKKQKRKKDKFAGLKIQQTIKTIKMPPPIAMKPIVKTVITPNAVKKTPQPIKFKTKKSKNNQKLSLQQNNKKKNQKILSQTKQKDNILLLANMLKKNNKKSSSLTTGLQNMLRK